jgi:CheY-like chemotaxis protein
MMGQISNTKKVTACANPEQRARRRILLVEDNRSVRDILSIILRSLGFEVALAQNGLEALAVFFADRFDLVLTDLQMPLMDGSRLAHLIKEMSPETPIILLTGADVETVRKKMENGSIDRVIFKPFKLDDLQDTVQGALELRKTEQGVMRVG